MRIDTVLGVFTLVMILLSVWVFRDPTQANHTIAELVIAVKSWKL